MKIVAVYSVFNEEEYIAYSIRSVYDHVDKIIVLLGMAPWTKGDPRARELFPARDGTEALLDRLAKGDPKIMLHKGLWDTDVQQRQVGMEYCIEQGMDYYFLVDGDEVYRTDHLRAIREEIAQHPEVGTFHIKCTVLWRSFRYRIPYWGIKWIPWRIFKITRHRPFLGFQRPYRCQFIGPERTNSLGPRYLIPPHKAVFYHFSYARSEARMRLKIATCHDQHRLIKDWMERVWLAWPDNRSMKNLEQLDPEGLPEALYVEPSDLPEVMREHPYWQHEIIR